jgi:hypothetical protein
MGGTQRLDCRLSLSGLATLAIAGIGLLITGGGPLNAQAPGPLANTCGVPPASDNPAAGDGTSTTESESRGWFR